MRVLEVTRDDIPKDFIILIPIGSIEQHGPHLPLGTDSIIAEHVAGEVERRFSGKVLLYPTRSPLVPPWSTLALRALPGFVLRA